MTLPLDVPVPNFGHLISMTDDRGTFEHALFDEPRVEHGYCTDDMARVLVVAAREPGPCSAAQDLATLSLRFIHEAIDAQGKSRNRMNCDGIWEDFPAVEDCWGRAVWGLGTAVAHCEDEAIRHSATRDLERAMRQRSTWPRAMSFAALGAAELLSVNPRNETARSLLRDAADMLAELGHIADWPWPEPRLTYANATVPEAMIAAGFTLDRPALMRRGLDLLEWLVDRQTRQGHLSVSPASGSGPDDRGPGFDQQPIEVSALADACARALTIDSNPQWQAGMVAAVGWFLGDNDGQVVMWDPISGGGFDGLEAGGANLNQGTESTLALLSTLQHARSLVRVHL